MRTLHPATRVTAPVFCRRCGDENGTEISITGTNGCLESDFDQYGDMEAFGVHPDWQRQLSKFASVQDRLREWKPTVMQKLTTFSCMAIKALDFDAIRIDKSAQVTVDRVGTMDFNDEGVRERTGQEQFLHHRQSYWWQHVRALSTCTFIIFDSSCG